MRCKNGRDKVAPLVGAWIEISVDTKIELGVANVAPLVGAWIEIFEACEKSKRHGVAPLVGAWIEIGISDDAKED